MTINPIEALNWLQNLALVLLLGKYATMQQVRVGPVVHTVHDGYGFFNHMLITELV